MENQNQDPEIERRRRIYHDDFFRLMSASQGKPFADYKDALTSYVRLANKYPNARIPNFCAKDAEWGAWKEECIATNRIPMVDLAEIMVLRKLTKDLMGCGRVNAPKTNEKAS